MANAQTGTIVVGSPQNITGVLFRKTNPATPLFNRLRDTTTDSRVFIMGADYQLKTPGKSEISEDASMLAPAPQKTAYSNYNNRTQIFQRTVQETYRSLGNPGELSPLQPAIVGNTNNRPNKLQTEKAFQVQEMRMDIEWAILNNTYHASTGTADADQTRGLLEAITTHTVNAGGAPLSYDLICTMAALLCAEFPDGLERTTILIDATTAMQLSSYVVNSDKFAGSQNQIGANVLQVLTPFGVANFLRISNKYLPAGTAVFADLNALRNVIQNIPGKGFFFYEDLAKVGASVQGQIYGEWGLDYGMEWLHGKITNLSTAVPTALGGKAVYVVNPDEFECTLTASDVTVTNDNLNVTVANEADNPVFTQEVPNDDNG